MATGQRDRVTALAPASPVPEPGRLPCLANWARWLEEDVAGLRAALGVFWDGAVYWIPARRTPDDRRACFDISRTLDLGPAPSCGALSFVLTDPRFGSGPFRVRGTYSNYTVKCEDGFGDVDFDDNILSVVVTPDLCNPHRGRCEHKGRNDYGRLAVPGPCHGSETLAQDVRITSQVTM